MEAQTIHRLLGISFIGEDSRRQTFDKNEENPIEADVIIIDEKLDGGYRADAGTPACGGKRLTHYFCGGC